MKTTAKQQKYEIIVSARKACRKCVGVHNPAVIEEGTLDSNHVGPWTGWQGNLDADLMVVGQDWGGHEYFVKFGGKEKDNNPTNARLKVFLKDVGYDIEMPELATGIGELYFTNAMLCCREGLLTENASTGTKAVQSVWFRNCESHLRAQIDLVNPKVIVTLGYYAYRSVLSSFGIRAESTMRAALASTHCHLVGLRSTVIPLYHCGNNGLRSRRLELQRADWNRVKIAMSR
jgi:uracil-DNA glycosylase